MAFIYLFIFFKIETFSFILLLSEGSYLAMVPDNALIVGPSHPWLSDLQSEGGAPHPPLTKK